jgi:hypothetical protein
VTGGFGVNADLCGVLGFGLPPRLLYIRSVNQNLFRQSNGQLVAAPASPLTQLNNPAQLPRAKSPRSAPEGSDQYRLHVVAANIADVVMSIGGLIRSGDGGMGCNHRGRRKRRGANDERDDRAIRILGGRVAMMAAAPDGTGSAPRPQVLAVATDVFVANEPLRRLVLGGPPGQCDRRPALGSTPTAESELQVRRGPTSAERRGAGVQISCPGRSGNFRRRSD